MKTLRPLEKNLLKILKRSFLLFFLSGCQHLLKNDKIVYQEVVLDSSLSPMNFLGRGKAKLTDITTQQNFYFYFELSLEKENLILKVSEQEAMHFSESLTYNREKKLFIPSWRLKKELPRFNQEIINGLRDAMKLISRLLDYSQNKDFKKTTNLDELSVTYKLNIGSMSFSSQRIIIKHPLYHVTFQIQKI